MNLALLATLVVILVIIVIAVAIIVVVVIVTVSAITAAYLLSHGINVNTFLSYAVAFMTLIALSILFFAFAFFLLFSFLLGTSVGINGRKVNSSENFRFGKLFCGMQTEHAVIFHLAHGFSFLLAVFGLLFRAIFFVFLRRRCFRSRHRLLNLFLRFRLCCRFLNRFRLHRLLFFLGFRFVFLDRFGLFLFRFHRLRLCLYFRCGSGSSFFLRSFGFLLGSFLRLRFDNSFVIKVYLPHSFETRAHIFGNFRLYHLSFLCGSFLFFGVFSLSGLMTREKFIGFLTQILVCAEFLFQQVILFVIDFFVRSGIDFETILTQVVDYCIDTHIKFSYNLI